MAWMQQWKARTLIVTVLAGVLVSGTAAIGVAPVDAANPSISGKKLSFTFDSADTEHVVDLEWKNSANVSSGNLVAEGGPETCTDPSEFFGESYGAPEGTGPFTVWPGHLSTATLTKRKATMVGSTTDCEGGPLIPVKTTYQLFTGAAANKVKITRQLGFSKTSGVFGAGTAGYVGVRPYVVRVSDSTFTDVIYPNGAGTAVTDEAAASCPFDCFTPVGTTWNGKWFADIDPTNGDAIIELRDPSMTAPVQLTVNYDGYSASLLASFVLVQPTKGWKHSVSETEDLCFADLTSWPQSARDAGQLPTNCTP
jgi:hypothetical protein